jgi:hypothetical protein
MWRGLEQFKTHGILLCSECNSTLIALYPRRTCSTLISFILNTNHKKLCNTVFGSNTEVHKAVVMDLQRIKSITNNEVLYNVGFRGTVTGESPITDTTDTIQDINALFLWNDSTRRINFVNDNSIALNAILSSSK